jgi:hypothetical protein
MLGLCQRVGFLFCFGWKTNQRGLFTKNKIKCQSCLPKLTNMNHTTTRGVSQCGVAICIKKYLKAKEELGKLKYFTMQKYISLQKIV